MSPFFPLPCSPAEMDAVQLREAWLLVAEARANVEPYGDEWDSITLRLWNLEWYEDQLE